LNDFLMGEEINENINNLPFNMSVSDLADFLGVCPATAYKITKDENFPKLKIPGRRLVIIPKPLFLEWYRSSCVSASKVDKMLNLQTSS